MLTTGLACIVAAIIGGGLKAFGLTIPHFTSGRRQLLLGIAGLLMVIVAAPINGGYEGEGADGGALSYPDGGTPADVRSASGGAGRGVDAASRSATTDLRVSRIAGVLLPGTPEGVANDPGEPMYLDIRSACNSFARDLSTSLADLEVVRWTGDQTWIAAVNRFVLDELSELGYQQFDDRGSLRSRENFHGHLPEVFVASTTGPPVVGFSWRDWLRSANVDFRYWVWCLMR